MDQLTELLRDRLRVCVDRNKIPDEGRRMDAAGKVPAGQERDSVEKMETGEEKPNRLQLHAAGKRPAVQGGDLEVEETEMREEMPSNLRSDVGLQLLAPGKRPEVQVRDSEEEIELPSNLRSDVGLQLLAPGKRPEVQVRDSEEEIELPSDLRSDVGLQLLEPGKRPEVQVRDSEEEIELPSNLRSDVGLQLLAPGKRPEVQVRDSEEEIELPSNLRSDVGLQLLAPGKRPEVQVRDSEEEIELPSDRRSDEGLQLHAAGKRPEAEVQGRDADEMDAVMRAEMLRILVQSMQPGDQKEKLAELLKYEQGNQRQKQKNQRRKQKMLQNLMQSMHPGDRMKEMVAKLLKYEEEHQQQKQESQPQKHKRKHNRKSRMVLRKAEMDRVKKSSPEKAAPLEDKAAAYFAAWEKEGVSDPESESDWHAYEARLHRDSWNDSFAAAGRYGTYETITSIPPMRFTDHLYEYASPCETLQIFSVEVVDTKEDIDWPLYVYGKIAVRDTVDHNRNIIFDRQKDNFQTVTKEHPYLTLTGPSRAAVLSVRHSYIEAELKIKACSSDSDDKDFSFLATGYIQNGLSHSFIAKRVLFSRLSTLEFTVGHIANSVEATIDVEVSSGKWPYGHGGAFTVCTASMDAMEIVLLAFGDDGLPLEADGKKIRLSRRVVGVEVDGKLNLSVKALPAGSSKAVFSDEQVFTPKEAGRSKLTLKVGSCEMKATVAWSLLLTFDE